MAQVDELKPKEAPAIPPANFTLNSDGFAYRTFMVRLPEGVVADDLKEPGLWRRIQGTGGALRKHDHVYLVEFNEAWAADAVVTDANNLQAVLSKPRLISFPERYDRLYQDEVYRVAWIGTGYVVERKVDGQRMTSPVTTPQMAERELIRLHPQQVSA